MLAEAERSYEKSIEVNAGYENGYFGLGQVREALGRPREALETYREGFRRNPKSLPLSYHSALVSTRLGLSDAPNEWKRALALGSHSAEVRTEYARWLWQGGQEQEAVHQAREALRRDPSYLPAVRLLAERGARQRLALAEALALEQAFRLSHAETDLAQLRRIAQADTSYGKRFARLGFPAPAGHPATGVSKR